MAQPEQGEFHWSSGKEGEVAQPGQGEFHWSSGKEGEVAQPGQGEFHWSSGKEGKWLNLDRESSTSPVVNLAVLDHWVSGSVHVLAGGEVEVAQPG